MRLQRGHTSRQGSAAKTVLIVLVVAHFIFAQQAFAQETATAVEVPAAIREQVGKVASKISPSVRLRRVSGNVQSGSSNTPVERFFERLDSGLWGVTTAYLVRGALVRSTLTLQGLVELTAVATVDRDFNIDSIIPIGKLFVPYGTNKNLKASGAIAITSLSGDLAVLSAPTAGSKFSYVRTATGQNTVATTGLFGGTRTHTLNISAKADCSAGPETEASMLHTQLRGKYLPVKCEGELNGSARIDEYAYLLDSGLYVALSSGNEKFSIEKVEYAP